MNWYELLFYKYIKGVQGNPRLNLKFNVYKGGTEQILPENGSAPTTAPIIADIRYTDALRTDQSFFYRESPISYDGIAKFTSIKGNTLVWNQLVQNGNFADTSGWQTYNGRTLTIANNTATVLTNEYTQGVVFRTDFKNVQEHVLYICADLTSDVELNYARFNFYKNGADYQVAPTYQNAKPTNVRVSAIWKSTMPTADRSNMYFSISAKEANATLQIKNFQIFDLTEMFGVGNEPSTVEEFTSLFSLPYYAYNQGSPLSFNGNGIKTVSKNQFNTQVITTSYAGLTLTKTQGTIRAVYSGGSQYAGFNFYGSPVFTDTFLKGKYRLSFDVSGLDTQWTVGLRRGASFLGGGQVLVISNDGHYSFTIDAEANPNCYLSFARTGNKTTACDVTFSNIQLELGTTETPYTPFEEQTISLPISTYFSNGMASAKNAYNNTIVYDELTPNKATKRLEQYTFTGNETISGITNLGTYYRCYISLSIPSKGVYATRWEKNVPNAYNYTDDSSHYYVQNSQFWYFTTSSTAEAIMNELSGTKFYYDLATPTETPITTEDANEALSLLMGKSVSSNNAKQMINIITKGE